MTVRPDPRLMAGAMSVAVPLLLLLLLSACGSGPTRSEVLADLADDTIIPAYEQLSSAAGDLARATSALCASPDSEELAAARESLARTRAAWSKTEPVWVGPVMDRRSWALVDWPIAVDEVEALISDTTIDLDADRLGNRIGADQRGLGAVEYVLYGSADGEATDEGSVLNQMADERRCRYLVGVSEVVAGEAAAVVDAWTVDHDDAGSYRDALVAEGGDGLDTIVNDILFLVEATSDAELGTALGEMESAADIEALHEGPAGLGAADLRAHLDGLTAVLVGDGSGDSTGSLAPLLGDDLHQRLADQLAAARSEAATIDGPLKQAVVDSPEAVSSTRSALKDLQVTVVTEVVSQMGVTVGFSDADGDTGN